MTVSVCVVWVWVEPVVVVGCIGRKVVCGDGCG